MTEQGQVSNTACGEGTGRTPAAVDDRDRRHGGGSGFEYRVESLQRRPACRNHVVDQEHLRRRIQLCAFDRPPVAALATLRCMPSHTRGRTAGRLPRRDPGGRGPQRRDV